MSPVDIPFYATAVRKIPAAARRRRGGLVSSTNETENAAPSAVFAISVRSACSIFATAFPSPSPFPNVGRVFWSDVELNQPLPDTTPPPLLALSQHPLARRDRRIERILSPDGRKYRRGRGLLATILAETFTHPFLRAINLC